MKTDICRCQGTREEHEKTLEAMKLTVAPVPGYNIPFILTCLKFQLDRKATWAAERGQPRPRMATLLTGCRTCGASSVTYHKDAKGRLWHTGCPGPSDAVKAQLGVR